MTPYILPSNYSLSQNAKVTLVASRIAAGFPSPADDFSEQGIQLNFFQPDLKDVIVQWEGQDVCLSILDNIARLGEERVRELVKFGSIVKA